MSILLFANNANSTLAGAITNIATTLNVQSGAGALFPSPTSGQYFIISLLDAATQTVREIMWCTARSSDTFTVVRAQEGTTASAWLANDLVVNDWTAGSAAQMLQQGQAVTNIVYSGTDSGSTNSIVSTVTPTIGSLTNNNLFEIAVAHANTNSVVNMNISTLGALNVVRADGTSLIPGDIQGPPYVGLFAYSSSATKFLLLNPCLWVNEFTNATGFTFYVDGTLGNDSNSGLSAGSGAFKTLQGAYNAISQDYAASYITISVASNTYGGVVINPSAIGQWNFSGVGTPIVDTTASSPGRCFTFNGSSGTVNGFQLSSYYATITASGSSTVIVENIAFVMGLSTSGCIIANSGAYVQIYGNNTLVGNCLYVFQSIGGSIRLGYSDLYYTYTFAMTITGTPTITSLFDTANVGYISYWHPSTSFSGTISGLKVTASNNGIFDSNSYGLSALPGSGTSISTGGQIN